MKIGISACLYGHKCRYDGTDKKNEVLLKALEGNELIPICPELCAGFPVPRKSIEILNDRVLTKDNKDLTDQLYQGCVSAFEQIQDCDILILKEKSPSCGVREIYDGSFTGKTIKGSGLFTRYCLEKGIPVLNEEDFM